MSKRNVFLASAPEQREFQRHDLSVHRECVESNKNLTDTPRTSHATHAVHSSRDVARMGGEHGEGRYDVVTGGGDGTGGRRRARYKFIFVPNFHALTAHTGPFTKSDVTHRPAYPADIFLTFFRPPAACPPSPPAPTSRLPRTFVSCGRPRESAARSILDVPLLGSPRGRMGGGGQTKRRRRWIRSPIDSRPKA